MAFYTDGVVPWNSLDDNTRAPLASEPGGRLSVRRGRSAIVQLDRRLVYGQHLEHDLAGRDHAGH